MRAVSLLGVFLTARGLLLAAGVVPLSPWTPLALLWQDILFVMVFAVCDHALRHRARIGWTLYALIVLYVAVNVPVACELATPLTMPLLRATRGPLADSILHHVTALNMLRLGLVLGVAVGLPLLLRRYRAHPAPRRQMLAILLLLVTVLAGPMASRRVDTLGLHRNFFVALLASAFPRLAARDLAGDWRISPFGQRAGEDLSYLRGQAKGRNVVLVHLESTAACYLRCYGAAEDPMPNLTALARQALVFENTYTAFPETIRSFTAVHSGIHPSLDIPSERYEHLGLPALGNVLQDAGYRTGLFHSGRFMYLGMDAVVRSRGFSTYEDAGDIGGERDSSFGIDEESTVRRILRWIDEGPDQPFLVGYLPIAGHHPYLSPTGRGPFPDEPAVNRYRNALHYADTVLGQLLDGLRRRDLEGRTLFILCGDHGQAFGQHPGNFGHTLFLYEENVRVPLIVAAPSLIGARRIKRVASLVDTMPTVLDLLGVTLPEGRQGHSLLQGPERMALFCTDYSLGLLGLRDGRWKIIHELETGRSRLFDLAQDPEEKDDLSQDHPGRVEEYVEHLRAWASAERFRAR
jgi:arylsulfatase A-like enzyme